VKSSEKIVTALLLLSSTAAISAPFSSFDPRSMAMGGAGVAVANPATAPFFNPALLSAANESDDFSVGIPVVGIRAYDPDDFVESVEDFQDNPAILDDNDDFVIDSHITAANAAIQAMNLSLAATELTAIANDARELSKGLATVSDKVVGADAGAGLVVAIPSKNLGAALSISGWSAGGGIAHYRDAETLEGLADDMDAYAACIIGGCNLASLSFEYVTVANGEVTFDATTNVLSTVDIRAIAVTEVALSFAHEFTLLGSDLSIGVTPKYRSIRIFDYTADVDSAENDDFSAADHTEVYSDFNADVGVAKMFGDNWRAGLVVKNIISVSYESKQGNDIELLPQVRAGLAYQNSWMTAAADLDITKNDPVSFERETQFASFGVEFNAFDWAQLRAGYRANLADSVGNVASVGLGLSPLGVHFDVAVAASEDELGASAQFGFRF